MSLNVSASLRVSSWTVGTSIRWESKGAIGYFGYDLARRLEHLPSIAQDDENLPEMQIGIYDWAVVVDHHEKCTFLASYGRAPLTRQHWGDLVALFTALRGTRQAQDSIAADRTNSPVLSPLSETDVPN